MNESVIASIKLANDGWIATDTANQRQHKDGDNQKKEHLQSPMSQKFEDLDISRLYSSTNIPSCQKMSQNLQPISISLLNTIQFEDY